LTAGGAAHPERVLSGGARPASASPTCLLLTCRLEMKDGADDFE